MRHLSRLLLPLLLLMFSGAPALAQNVSWTISEAKGSVVVIDGRGERAASVGLAVAPGAIVRTKALSSAVLVRGQEFVTLRQNAQIRIAPEAREKSLFQIIQDFGSALFNIGKKADPHFGVQTPYLAAVVKGTTFVIAVSEDGATLQVTEGAVEASTLDGGARELVLPGAVAMIAAGDPLRLMIEGEGRKMVDSPARPADAPAAAAPAANSGTAAAASSDGSGPVARGDNRVESVVLSTPGEASNYSGGFVSGEVAALASVVAADNSARGNALPFSTDGGRDEEMCARGGCAPDNGNNGVGNGVNSDDDGDGPGNGGNDGGMPDNPGGGGMPDNPGGGGAPDNPGGGGMPDNPGGGGGRPDNPGGPPNGAGPPDDDFGDDGDDGNGNNGNGNGNGGGNGTGDEGRGNDGDNGNGNGNGDGGDRGGPGIRIRVDIGGDGINLGLSARDGMIEPGAGDVPLQP